MARDPKKWRTIVRSTLRNEVRDQTVKFREEALQTTPVLRCGLTGARVRGRRWDVDHVGMTFGELADSWVRATGLTYYEVHTRGFGRARRLKDRDLAWEWRDYHRRNATLAPALHRENCRAGSKGYKADPELIGGPK